MKYRIAGVDVKRITDVDAFLASAGPLLLEDEARHNLILGIAGTLRDHPAVYAQYHLWIVEDGHDVVGAALQTPPFNLVVPQPRTPEALVALAEALHGDAVELPGVTAAVPEGERFAEAWSARSGLRPRLRVAQRVYRATEIRAPAAVPGRARSATADDRELLVSWIRAFADEVLHDVGSPARDAERTVDGRLREGAGGFVLWEDDGPVSLAGFGGRTPNGIRIGPVYTPPEHRRRGYGSAATAFVSVEQLARGRRFCFLYTDLANPISNRIYTDIGYEPVCDSLDIAFDAP